MFSKRFEKETFKQTVKDNIRTLYRKTIEEANPQQVFQAVSYAVKDVIFDDWFATQKAYDKADAKTVYYMSMEFLMGRALGNNLINMTVYKDVKEALDEMGIDLNVVEDQVLACDHLGSELLVIRDVAGEWQREVEVERCPAEERPVAHDDDRSVPVVLAAGQGPYDDLRTDAGCLPHGECQISFHTARIAHRPTRGKEGGEKSL